MTMLGLPSLAVADVAQTLATLHAWIGIEHPAFPTALSPQDVETTLFQLLDLLSQASCGAEAKGKTQQALGMGVGMLHSVFERLENPLGLEAVHEVAARAPAAPEAAPVPGLGAVEEVVPVRRRGSWQVLDQHGGGERDALSLHK